MDAAVDIGSNPVSKHQFRRQGIFPWSADHVNRIGNLPVDLYSATWYMLWQQNVSVQQ